MRPKRMLYLAVIGLIAAFCFLAGPAAAGCPEGDPCIQPPQSQEIDVDASSEDGGDGDAQEPGALTPALVSVPPPAFVEPVPFAVAEGFAKTPPDFDVLQIPLRRQDPADVSCGVQALGMALAGLEGVAPTSEAILSFLQHEGWMFEYGTSVEGLALAAQYFGYEGSVPFAGWSIERLQKELVAGRPVVVALGANGPDQPGHFVTVIGVSTDGAWIAYNDPLLGRQVVPRDGFTRIWDLQGDSGVAVARTPPPPASPDYASWMAMFAGLMASLALAPSVLRSRTRMGVGGAIEAQVDESTGSKTRPPYPAPPGYEWKPMQETVYAWRDVRVTEKVEVPNMVYKQVQVGTRRVTEKVPAYRTVTVDKGYWKKKKVKKKKWVWYVKGYRYKTKRLPKPGGGWAYVRRRVPVYGKKKKTYWVEKKVWVPNPVEVQELAGHYVVEREEPVYEWQWVQEGTKFEERTKVERQKVPVGIETKWKLERLINGTLSDATESDLYATSLPPSLPVNLEHGKRPPDIPVPIWNLLSEVDQEEILEQDTQSYLDWWRKEVLPAGRGASASMQEWEALSSGGKPVLATNPLKVRAEPGMEGEVLTYASEGEALRWTGKFRREGETDWYEVITQDPFRGEVRGWVSSKYLKSKAAKAPEIDGIMDDGDLVDKLFGEQGQDVLGTLEDQLMQNSAEWLVLRAGPGMEYAKIGEIPWGRALLRTGRYKWVNGSLWWEVMYYGKRGWVSNKYLKDFDIPEGYPDLEPGHVWVPLKGKYSFSVFFVVDVENYKLDPGEPEEFLEKIPITLTLDSGEVKTVEVPIGSLFGPRGVAMQGSGFIEHNDEMVYFKLDNPDELDWIDDGGQHVSWRDGAYERKDGTNSFPREILNIEKARFLTGSIAKDLVSYKSAAAAPELRGATIFAPELVDATKDNGVFTVEDGGGAFPPGETRIDIFIFDEKESLRWYTDFERERGPQIIYIQQPTS